MQLSHPPWKESPQKSEIIGPQAKVDKSFRNGNKKWGLFCVASTNFSKIGVKLEMIFPDENQTIEKHLQGRPLIKENKRGSDRPVHRSAPRLHLPWQMEQTESAERKNKQSGNQPR